MFFSTTCWIVLCCLSMSITLCKTEATLISLISSGPWFGSLFKSNATNWKYSSSFESLILIKASIISQASFSWADLAKESLRCCVSIYYIIYIFILCYNLYAVVQVLTSWSMFVQHVVNLKQTRQRSKTFISICITWSTKAANDSQPQCALIIWIR